MRVIVTRPAAQAHDWVGQLRRHAVDAVALPLIAIVPVADPAPLQKAWRELALHRLVFFVSPNAVDQFFAHRPPDATWPNGTLAASPGPGTTRSLVRVGLSAHRTLEPAADAPQFDAEALWVQLRPMDWRDASVLIVRGDGGRDGLAQHLRTAGARVSHVSAYRRALPTLEVPTTELLRQALDAPAAHLWFFSSSEAIDNLQTCAPGADFSRARAIATHPRIVAHARQSGFAQVAEARPALEAVVACIQSMQP